MINRDEFKLLTNTTKQLGECREGEFIVFQHRKMNDGSTEGIVYYVGSFNEERSMVNLFQTEDKCWVTMPSVLVAHDVPVRHTEQDMMELVPYLDAEPEHIGFKADSFGYESSPGLSSTNLQDALEELDKEISDTNYASDIFYGAKMVVSAPTSGILIKDVVV